MKEQEKTEKTKPYHLQSLYFPIPLASFLTDLTSLSSRSFSQLCVLLIVDGLLARAEKNEDEIDQVSLKAERLFAKLSNDPSLDFLTTLEDFIDGNGRSEEDNSGNATE